MARQAQKKTAKPITAAQIKRIHATIHALRIDDDTYRLALSQTYGVTTSKDLSMNQARAFIRDLEEIAMKVEYESQRRHTEQTEKEPARFSDLANRPGMATPPQLRKIEAMWRDVNIVPEPDARSRALRRFIQRIAGVADMRFLDSQMVSKVICALQAMQQQATEPAKTQKPKNAV
ncbi:MAG: regulatory protein GemA [Deltaproteobacteria bacterium]|nr:regulatory protein GemA [Deltaproteobacteria bacterium]